MFSLGLVDEILITGQLRVKRLVVSISVRGWEKNLSQINVFIRLKLQVLWLCVHAAEKETEKEAHQTGSPDWDFPAIHGFISWVYLSYIL